MTLYVRWFLKMAGIVVLLAGCNVYKPQSEATLVLPPASAFLLDPSVFPKGWTFESYEQGTIVAGRDFYLPNASGHSFEEVYRRPNETQASKKYKEYLDGEFNVSGTRQPAAPFASPPEITFKTKVADEYYFACGVDVVPQCKMLARYRNYFVFMYFDVSTEKSPGGLTYPEIEHVLEALEDKASNALGVSTGSTSTK